MANQLASFDPVGRFQGARSTALSNEARSLGLQQAKQDLPRQNALADIQLRQAQQGEQAGLRQAGISQESSRVKFLNQFGLAMEQIPTLEGRMRAAQTLAPLAQKVGVDPAVFTPENLSIQGIQQLLSTTSSFINDPSKLSAAQQEFASLTKDLSPEDLKKARRIKLRLDPGAVGSAVQTITDAGTAEDIGDTEAIISERKKFGELTGSSRAKRIDSGFDRITQINTGLRNIDRALTALDEGAKTGRIESNFFPSIRAASIKLDQLQNEFALDVISGVTLGAISEAELALAKEVGLPKNLNEDDLKIFLQDKKAAQEKVREYFERQIQFLNSGGDIADFVASERQQRGGQVGAPQAQPAQGADAQALMQEAEAAIAAGADRNAVMQRLQQMTGAQ